MDERLFADEFRETKAATLNCSWCKSTDTYDLKWLLRRKKKRLPPNLPDAAQARFAKFISYMVLMDDKAQCSNPNCRKMFDISGIKTMAYLTDPQETVPEARREQQRESSGDRPPQQQQQKSFRPRFDNRREGGPPNREAGAQEGQGNRPPFKKKKKRKNKGGGGPPQQQGGGNQNQPNFRGGGEPNGNRWDYVDNRFGTLDEQKIVLTHHELSTWQKPKPFYKGGGGKSGGGGGRRG